jgi:hypothetical protein
MAAQLSFYESAPDALTGIVNGMRDEFLSRAGSSLDEDSRISEANVTESSRIRYTIAL